MSQRQQLIEQIRRESIQKRAQALREAAQRQAFKSPIAAAGASGSGSGSRGGCLPAGGVSMTGALESEMPVDFSRIFFYPDGTTLNGRPVYSTYTISYEEGEDLPLYVILQIGWSGSRWEYMVLIKEGDVVIYDDLLSYSAELYSTDWNNVSEGFDVTILSTVPGEEFSCDLRYCLTIEETGFSSVGPAQPYWVEIDLGQFPNAFDSGGDIFLIWGDKESSWIVVNSFDDAILLGGSRTKLPTGTFDLQDGKLLTIQQGVCGFQ